MKASSPHRDGKAIIGHLKKPFFCLVYRAVNTTELGQRYKILAHRNRFFAFGLMFSNPNDDKSGQRKRAGRGPRSDASAAKNAGGQNGSRPFVRAGGLIILFRKDGIWVPRDKPVSTPGRPGAQGGKKANKAQGPSSIASWGRGFYLRTKRGGHGI